MNLPASRKSQIKISMPKSGTQTKQSKLNMAAALVPDNPKPVVSKLPKSKTIKKTVRAKKTQPKKKEPEPFNLSVNNSYEQENLTCFHNESFKPIIDTNHPVMVPMSMDVNDTATFEFDEEPKLEKDRPVSE